MERGSKSRQSGEQKVAQYATMVHSYSHVADEPEMALLKQCMSEAGQVRIPTIDWPEMLLQHQVCMSEDKNPYRRMSEDKTKVPNHKNFPKPHTPTCRIYPRRCLYFGRRSLAI